MKSIALTFAILTAGTLLHAAEATPSAQLSQFKLGAYITGPQATLDSAAGKAVLIDA